MHRSLLVPVINQSNSQVPYQLVIAKIAVLIQTVETFTLELVSVGQFYVLQEVLMHLHTPQNLQ